TMDILNRIKLDALEPQKIESLIHLINEDLGFKLYRAIERTKVELSETQTNVFKFVDSPISIENRVTRSEFESWIDPYITEMSSCIDRLLKKSNIAAGDVDSVFMTGGSSFVPAVRNLFAKKFGPSKLKGGGELTSVAEGLGLRAISLFS